MERNNNCKKHNKLIYILIYVVMIFFGGGILAALPSRFIVENIVFFVYIIVFFFVVILFYREIISAIRKIGIKQLDQLCCIGTFTILAEVASGIVLSNFFQTENLHQINIDTQKNSANFVLWNMTVIFLAPITEEFFYRYCMVDLSSRYRMLSNIISVFLFSFMHVWEYVFVGGDFTQFYSMMPYIALGTGLVILYNKTQNICLPILLHVLVNVIAELA